MTEPLLRRVWRSPSLELDVGLKAMMDRLERLQGSASVSERDAIDGTLNRIRSECALLLSQ